MERRTQTRCVPVQRRRTGFERLGPPCRTKRKPVETGSVLVGVVDEFAKRLSLVALARGLRDLEELDDFATGSTSASIERGTSVNS